MPPGEFASSFAYVWQKLTSEPSREESTSKKEGDKRREKQKDIKDPSTPANDAHSSFRSDDSLNAGQYLSPQGHRIAKTVSDTQQRDPETRYSLLSAKRSRFAHRSERAHKLLKPVRGSEKPHNRDAVPLPKPGSTFSTASVSQQGSSSDVGHSGMPPKRKIAQGGPQPRNDLGKTPSSVTLGQGSIPRVERSSYLNGLTPERPAKRRRTSDYEANSAVVPDSNDNAERVRASEDTDNTTLKDVRRRLPKPVPASSRMHRSEEEYIEEAIRRSLQESNVPSSEATDNGNAVEIAHGSTNQPRHPANKKSRHDRGWLRNVFKDASGRRRAAPAEKEDSADELAGPSEYNHVKRVLQLKSNNNHATASDSASRPTQHTSNQFHIKEIFRDGERHRLPGMVLQWTNAHFRVEGEDGIRLGSVMSPTTFKKLHWALNSLHVMIEHESCESIIVFDDRDDRDRFCSFVERRLQSKPQRVSDYNLEKMVRRELAKNYAAAAPGQATHRQQGIGLNPKPTLEDEGSESMKRPKLSKRLQLQGQNEAPQQDTSTRHKTDEGSERVASNLKRYQAGERFLSAMLRSSSNSDVLSKSPRPPSPESHLAKRRSTLNRRFTVPYEDEDNKNADSSLELVSDLEKGSRIVDSGTPWKHPLTYPKEGKNRAQVDFSDLVRLDEGEFLNDNLITFYIRYLIEQHPEGAEGVYFFNTFFYTSLKQGKHDAVKKWTRNVNVFDYDYLVVPINEGLHWYLAIICNLKSIKWQEPKKQQLVEGPTIILDGAEAIPEDDVRSKQGADKEKEASDDQLRPLENRIEEILQATSNSSSDHAEVLTVSDSTDQLKDTTQNSDGKIVDLETAYDLQMIETAGKPNKALFGNADEFQSLRARSSIHDRDYPLGEELPSPGQIAAVQERNKKRGRFGSGSHAYDPNIPAIITLDSLTTRHSDTAKTLKEYLVAEAADKLGKALQAREIQGMTGTGIPAQSNWVDCGLYVLLYLERFLQDPRTFATKLLQRKFDEHKDWPSVDGVGMRVQIRGLLQQLHEKQDEERKLEKAAKKQAAQAKSAQPAAADVASALPSKNLDCAVDTNNVERANPAEQTRPEPQTLATVSSLGAFPIDKNSHPTEDKNDTIIKVIPRPLVPPNGREATRKDNPRATATDETTGSSPKAVNLSVVVPPVSIQNPVEDADKAISTPSRTTGEKSGFFASESGRRTNTHEGEERPHTRGKPTSQTQEAKRKDGRRRSQRKSAGHVRSDDVIEID